MQSLALPRVYRVEVDCIYSWTQTESNRRPNDYYIRIVQAFQFFIVVILPSSKHIYLIGLSRGSLLLSHTGFPVPVATSHISDNGLTELSINFHQCIFTSQSTRRTNISLFKDLFIVTNMDILKLLDDWVSFQLRQLLYTLYWELQF